MDMLSRVADSLYWMARYLERAEHTARILDVHLGLQLEALTPSRKRHQERMIAALGLEPPEDLNETDLVQWLCFDLSNRLSIVASIMSARDNARAVREQTSSEMWEQLNRLFHEVRSYSMGEEWLAEQGGFLRGVRNGAHLFQGITDATMNHGQGWQFIQLGRYIERASATANLLDRHFREFLPSSSTTIDYLEHSDWIALLKSCSAFEAYCRVYTADLKPERIAEFLLLNAEFPHSLRFAVDAIHRSMPAQTDGSRRNSGRPARLAGKLRASLSFSQMDEITAAGVHDFLADVQRQCTQIHNSVHQVYVEYPIESAIEV